MWMPSAKPVYSVVVKYFFMLSGSNVRRIQVERPCARALRQQTDWSWAQSWFMIPVHFVNMYCNTRKGSLEKISTLPALMTKTMSITTLRKKCYWIKRISFQKNVYHGFKSICYRISNIFIGSCSIFLWINSIHAFGKKCYWFNSIFFSVYTFFIIFLCMLWWFYFKVVVPKIRCVKKKFFYDFMTWNYIISHVLWKKKYFVI